jgi:hypothetical protein
MPGVPCWPPCAVQPSLPFHVANVESNDTLYVGDPQYSVEVNLLLDESVAVSAPAFLRDVGARVVTSVIDV